MTPSAFKFHVSVPRDASLVVVLCDLAAHAAEYAQLDAAGAAGFVARVEAACQAAMAGEGSCGVDVESADGELRMTIAGETVRQPLTA